MTTDLGPRENSAGFTLIEALVALSILAIAASALMAAASAHIERVTGLEERALAQIVAENRLAELRIDHRRPDPSSDRTAMGHQEWMVTTGIGATSDPDLVDVTISVAPVGKDEAIVTMRGFIDTEGRP